MGRTSRRIPSGFLPPGIPAAGWCAFLPTLSRQCHSSYGLLAGPLYAQPPMNQADLTALLKRLAPTDWPRIWGAIYGHREACIAALQDAAGTSLETPDASGSNAGLLASIAALVLAATLALGGAAWYVARRE